MNIETAKEVIGIFGLVFFFVFFLGVLAWVFRPGAAANYRKWARIPLDEGDAPDETDE